MASPIADECLERNRKRTPRRFKVFLLKETIIFSKIVAIEMMWLDVGRTRKAPIFYIIDTKTHLQNAMFSNAHPRFMFGTHLLRHGVRSTLAML